MLDTTLYFCKGNDSLNFFIGNTLHWDSIGCTNGTIVISFILEVSGEITNVRVFYGVPDCKECFKECMRVAKLTEGMWYTSADFKYPIEVHLPFFLSYKKYLH